MSLPTHLVDTSDPVPPKPRIAVDWDGTCVEGVWPRHDGDWKPGAVEALKRLDEIGDVVIWSCRVADCAYPSASTPAGDILRPEAEVTAEVYGIKAKLKEIGLGHLEVWERSYKPPAIAYIDDRAIRYDGEPRSWYRIVAQVENDIAKTSEVGIGGNETLPAGFACGADGIPTSSIEVGDIVRIGGSYEGEGRDWLGDLVLVTEINANRHWPYRVKRLDQERYGLCYRSELELVSKAVPEKPELDMPDDEEIFDPADLTFTPGAVIEVSGDPRTFYKGFRFQAEPDNRIPVDFGEETRSTDTETGGQKGMKPTRLDLISPIAQVEEAKVYGAGALKYDEHNWRRGYDWSKSYAALQRHLTAWWGGEDLDPETGLSHLAHARWHTGVLLEFAARGLGTDDRHPVFVQREVSA